MAEFVPMRTGRLVVRYHAPWRRRLMGAGGLILGVLLLYLMFELGRFQGGYSKVAELKRRAQFSARLDALQEQNEKLRQQVAAAELARDVDRKAYADVEKNLAELQAQVLKQREELTFYRGIVSPEDGIGGLRIQRFQVLPGVAPQEFRLRLVLVQSMRQDAVVSGAVHIRIEGVVANRPVQLGLAESGVSEGADGRLPFQLRYFKNLERDVRLPTGFEPRAVNVEVRSGNSPPVRESYPWQVSLES